jgi:hypothetical protein
MAMRRILFLCANMLAAFFDLTAGACIAAIVAMNFGVELLPAQLIFGSIFAVLPDFDLFIPILSDTFRGDHHTTLFHRPLIMLPVSILIAGLIGGSLWAVIAGLCVFSHFLHDTRDFGGGGIAWFWPFSKKYWSLRGGENGERVNIHRRWIHKNWLQPSVLSVIECVCGCVLLAITSYIVKGSLLLSVVIFFVLFSGIGIFWGISRIAFGTKNYNLQ